MFFVGEVVKPSGKGRTATWEGMAGTVTRVEGLDGSEHQKLVTFYDDDENNSS